MKKILLGLTAVLSSTVAHGQTTFQKAYGGIYHDEAGNVQQTNDGGYIITGLMTDIPWYGYHYLIKTNSLGDTIWTKAYIAPDSIVSYPGGVSYKTNDNGFILSFPSYDNFDQDIYAIKTDSLGNIIWSKTYGGTKDERGKVIPTNDGGFIIIGSTNSFGVGLHDIWLVKTDGNGDTLWTKTYGTTSYAESDGKIIEESNGNFIIGGNFYDSTLLMPFGFFIIKTNSIGDTIWTKKYNIAEWLTSMVSTSDGSILISATALSDTITFNYNTLVIKTDSNGDTLWSNFYLYQNNQEYYGFLTTTNDNGFVICATTITPSNVQDLLFIKADSTGNVLWSKTYGQSNNQESFVDAFQTNDDGFLLLAHAHGIGIGGGIYVIKSDSSGNAGCLEFPVSVIATLSAHSYPYFYDPIQIKSGGNFSSINIGIKMGGIVELVCPTSVEETFLPFYKTSISPNPFSSRTTLQTNTLLRNATLTVDNCFGQTVKEIKNISGQTVTLYRDNLPSGLYFVRLTEENKTIAVAKLYLY